MKKKSIFAGAGVLAVCSVLGKIVGAFYRIPLTNLLGGEGMGLYQTVFPLYTLILTVSSGGVPVAISGLVARKRRVGDERGVKKTITTALRFFLIVGVVFSLLIFALSKPVALLQGERKATIAYIGIAPAITFVCVLSVLRGYYQGKENMLPSALSSLVEQVVKLFVGLYLCTLLKGYGVEWAVFGAVLGISVAELIATLCLLIPYLFKRRNGRVRTPSFSEISAENAIKTKPRIKDGTLKKIIATALPVTLGSMVMPLTAVVDSLLVVNILSRTMTTADALSSYGLLTGTVATLINLPVVIISALPTALLPAVVASTNEKERKTTIYKTILASVALGILSVIAFAFTATPVIKILYGRNLTDAQVTLCANLLKLSTISIIFVSVISSCTSALQGLGKPSVPAFNLAVGGAFKVAVSAISLFFLGIYGAVLGTICCYGVTAILDFTALRKETNSARSDEKEKKIGLNLEH